MWEHLPSVIVYSRHPLCLHNIDNSAALERGIKNRHSPLTVAGELQREITAKYVQNNFPDIDLALCSNYERTWKIPEAAGMSSILIQDERLNERYMGVWHDYPRDEVLKLHPGENIRFRSSRYYDYCAPGGESCHAVEERLRNLFSDAQLFLGSKCAFISGHGISGLSARMVLTGGTIEDWHVYDRDRLKNASVTVYRKFGDRYICTQWNYVPWLGLIDPELLKKKGTEA